MGGRGLDTSNNSSDKDKWQWLRDVESSRLEKYIKRSLYLGDKPDPKSRSIHDVAYHAERELKRRWSK